MKRFILIVLCFFTLLPCFAERRTRTDRWENVTCKIVWDTEGIHPDEKWNFAMPSDKGKDFYTSFYRVTQYVFVYNESSHYAVEAIMISERDSDYIVDWRVLKNPQDENKFETKSEKVCYSSYSAKQERDRIFNLLYEKFNTIFPDRGALAKHFGLDPDSPW